MTTEAGNAVVLLKRSILYAQHGYFIDRPVQKSQYNIWVYPVANFEQRKLNAVPWNLDFYGCWNKKKVSMYQL